MVFSVISWQRHGLPPGGSLSLTTLHGFRHIGTARLTRTWPSVCNSNIMYVYIYNVYIYNVIWYNMILYNLQVTQRYVN
jgi:predicted ABC-type sugar transport system permease subunit